MIVVIVPLLVEGSAFFNVRKLHIHLINIFSLELASICYGCLYVCDRDQT